MPTESSPSTSEILETREAIADYLSGFSFQIAGLDDWLLEVREPHLGRNRGCVNVIRVQHEALKDCRTGQLTRFDMEVPIELGHSKMHYALALWNLIWFTTLHETSEFYKRDGEPFFNPHDVEHEETIYGQLPVLWRTGE